MRYMQAARTGVLLLLAVLAVETSMATAQSPMLTEPPEADAFADNQAAPHPEPRVIVNVLSVRGPHERGSVERSARLAWGRLVRCHQSIDRQARGTLGLELVIASRGKVTRARRTRSTFKNRDLTQCLANAIKDLPMPKAHANSTAIAEVHMAPGDPPHE